VLAGQVEAPVFLEVPVADHGAQGEDGLGAVQAPSCSADVEPVADQVSADLSQARRLLGGLAPPRLDGAALRAWSDPGWIKVAMEFRLELIPAGTLLSTETRILATDPSSRRFFAAYWFLIRASSAAIRREVRSWCQPWSNVIRRSKRSGECRLVCPDRHFLTPGFGPTRESADRRWRAATDQLSPGAESADGHPLTGHHCGGLAKSLGSSSAIACGSRPGA
jgi:hypothetical protein